jgi:hypothetical protein
MQFLRTYKNIFIQAIVFLAIGLYKHHSVLIILAVILFLLPLAAPGVALKYMHTLETLLNKIGYWIKNLLFFLLYFIVICPISFILYLQRKSTVSGFKIRNIIYQPSDFEKMW